MRVTAQAEDFLLEGVREGGFQRAVEPVADFPEASVRQEADCLAEVGDCFDSRFVHMNCHSNSTRFRMTEVRWSRSRNFRLHRNSYHIGTNCFPTGNSRRVYTFLPDCTILRHTWVHLMNRLRQLADHHLYFFRTRRRHLPSLRTFRHLHDTLLLANHAKAYRLLLQIADRLPTGTRTRCFSQSTYSLLFCNFLPSNDLHHLC